MNIHIKGGAKNEQATNSLPVRMRPNHLLMDAQTIGKHIREARKALGKSQALFARRFNVSPQAVGKWERGESLPDVIMLGNIAAAAGKDVCEFLDLKSHRCNCGHCE